MAVPGVVYTLDPAAGRWVAPGRGDLPALAGFRLGVTEPTRDNTGAGADGYDPPTRVLGDGTTSVTVRPGEVLEDTVVRGWVNLHVGATLRNCAVTGAEVPADGRPLVNVVVPPGWDGTTQALIDHCTVQPVESSRALGYSAGVGIKAYRLVRSKVADCIDALTVSGGATAPAVTVEGCFLGDLTVLRPDPWGYWPATHNDAIQLHGSSVPHPPQSVSVLGTTVEARPGGGSNVDVASIVDGSAEVSLAGVMISRPTGAYSSVLLERCWLHGGNQTVNAVATGVTARIVVRGCRLERGTADGGNPVDGLPHVAAYVDAAYDLTWEDDVWICGGAASAVRRK